MRNTFRVLPIVILLAALANLCGAFRAESLPLYSARQGLKCQSCHFDPNGGGPRNESGFAFARNRHASEPDTTGPWQDLDLANRVSENLPVYFGLDQRFMLFGNSTSGLDSIDRLVFFNMENAAYLVFQPHARLTLVYVRDGFDEGSMTHDAFGMISGLPGNSYLKAGRFRTPFGLRMDDHTVATRNSFLELQHGGSFLPYDPRHPDMGIEAGADRGPLFARAAFTNGATQINSPGPFASAATVKLGCSYPTGQAAVSFYDNYVMGNDGGFRRATRWGAYALAHWRRFAFIGELGAGTTEQIGGGKWNLLAGYVEANYEVSRVVNLRGRYEQFQGERDGTLITRPDDSRVSRSDLATYQRYALEGEVQPVPFAELRWSLCLIDPRASADALGNPRRTETQSYLQFHFSY
jgi:hypothetical protein